MPYSPCHLKQGYENGEGTIGDITLGWTRRVRKNGDLQDNIDAPLDELFEKYDVEIYQDNTYGVLLRTFTAVSTSSKLYTVAQQTANFGASTLATAGWIVYQYSDQLGGRGFGAKGTMTVQT